MNISEIKRCLAQGKIVECLKYMDRHDNFVIMTQGRLNGLNTQIRMGTINNSDSTIQMNKINAAIISYLEDNYNIVNDGVDEFQNEPVMTIKDSLLKIISENKFRRKDIAKKANDLLDAFNIYDKEKAKQLSYDPVSRRYKVLVSEFNTLVESLLESKLDDTEAIIDKINNFLNEDDSLPYKNLDQAYKLANGRGFKDTWIEDQLKNKPNDVEVRITIAEKIDRYISTIISK